MKQEIIQAIICECSDAEKAAKLFKLYNSHPHANKSFAFRMNSNAQSDAKKVERLIYELRKLENISDVDLYIANRDGVKPEAPKAEKPKKEESKPAAADKKEPEKFREEYPFLNNPDIPEEFKILAADKITAFKTLTDGHAQLQAAAAGESDLTEPMLAQIAKDVAAADELNSLIHEEFAHYQETGEVLGKHPIFVQRMIQAKVDKMTGEEKLKRFNTLNKDIKREQTNLAKAEAEGDNDKIQKIADRLLTKETELNLLRKLTQ